MYYTTKYFTLPFSKIFFCEEQIQVKNEKNHTMSKSRIKSKYQFFDLKKQKTSIFT